MSYKRLKEGSELSVRIENLENYLLENNLEIEVSRNISNGLIVRDSSNGTTVIIKGVGNRMNLPRMFDDVFLVSDENGNAIDYEG